MESKLIEKINLKYQEILNTLKSFVKDNFNLIKEKKQRYDSLESWLLKLQKKDKSKEVEEYIIDFSNKNDKIDEKLKQIKNMYDSNIKEIINNKNKIVENSTESFYLIKHPNDCLFLLNIDKYNENISNYIILLEKQIQNNEYDKIETIYYLLCNMKCPHS